MWCVFRTDQDEPCERVRLNPPIMKSPQSRLKSSLSTATASSLTPVAESAEAGPSDVTSGPLPPPPSISDRPLMRSKAISWAPALSSRSTLDVSFPSPSALAQVNPNLQPIRPILNNLGSSARLQRTLPQPSPSPKSQTYQQIYSPLQSAPSALPPGAFVPRRPLVINGAKVAYFAPAPERFATLSPSPLSRHANRMSPFEPSYPSFHSDTPRSTPVLSLQANASPLSRDSAPTSSPAAGQTGERGAATPAQLPARSKQMKKVR